MGGSIHVAIESIAALASPMQAGLLKGLAVVSASRLPDLPDLPTVGEVVPQLRGFDARGWVALMARTGTPEAIVQKINRDIRTIMTDPEVARRLSALGVIPAADAGRDSRIHSERKGSVASDRAIARSRHAVALQLK